MLWLLGWLLVLAFPQLPDGDSTARTQFLQWYGAGWHHQVRQAWWWNLGGALFAWGCISWLFSPTRTRLLALLGLLLVGGWGYSQTIGWQGDLFLAPNTPTRLSDSQTVITFQRFTLPPAPDGAGRALEMEIVVNGQAYTISEATPYQGNGWTVRPKWYGAFITHPRLAEPLYIGASGTTSASLSDGQTVSLQVNIETLTLTSDPPLPDFTIDYYAIVTAEYP